MAFEIVDLFSGPGGLSEGFRAAGRSSRLKANVSLSVEMDDWAVQTLRQRAFQTAEGPDDHLLQEVTLVAGRVETPDWSEVAPSRWGKACREVLRLELGTDDAWATLAPKLEATRERTHGDTILIGGPPCQAYSLVGRARNRGKTCYVPEDDHRHYLYREYVRILAKLQPAAFIMENVKGILSSRVDGGGIFHRILDDLSNTADGYVLVPLTLPVDVGRNLQPKDFLIRAEEHGIPQQRHRVIILGIRSDLAGLLPNGQTLLPQANGDSRPGVRQALVGLPGLRSGLSTRDSTQGWRDTIKTHIGEIQKLASISEETRALLRKVDREFPTKMPQRRFSHAFDGIPEAAGEFLSWVASKNFTRLANHETRGHRLDDLARYLFAASFARAHGISPKLSEFPQELQPNHKNRDSGKFADRFRVQLEHAPAKTITSHISKDGHYFIHPDPTQCRALTVREAARLQTFPDDYSSGRARIRLYHASKQGSIGMGIGDRKTKLVRRRGGVCFSSVPDHGLWPNSQSKPRHCFFGEASRKDRKRGRAEDGKFGGFGRKPAAQRHGACQ